MQTSVHHKLNRPSSWSASLPPNPQQIKTTFQDLINALRSISPVQFLAPPPIILCIFIHSAFSTLQNGTRKKVKTERLNVKMGHSALAAYLMHISPLSTCWRHFSHNCLQLKVNTQKRNFQSFYIKPRNAMPPVCCWAWTQKALFTICFKSFSDSLVL